MISSKIKIIIQDADTIAGTDSDCLFLDHFEKEDRTEIIDRVRAIAQRNETKFLWFWPLSEIYARWTFMQSKEINNDTFAEWSASINIPNLPITLSDSNLASLSELKNKYMDLRHPAVYPAGNRHATLTHFKKFKFGQQETKQLLTTNISTAKITKIEKNTTYLNVFSNWDK